MNDFDAFADSLALAPTPLTALKGTSNHALDSEQPATVAKCAPPPFETADWPAGSEETVRLFIASTGFVPASLPAVVACVVVDGLAGFEARWQSGIASMLEDPQLRDEPEAAAALRRHDFGYATAPALRLRIAQLLRSLGFEAYVGFTRRDAGDPATPASLLEAIVFDRLRAYRGRTVIVNVDSSDAAHLEVLSSAARGSAARVRELHADAREPAVDSSETRSAAAIVARHVAAIVHERIAQGKTARAFNQIHPAKLRVIYELESGKYFTRHNPFTG